MRTVFLVISVAALGVLGCFACCFQVEETEYAIVTRFGKPQKVIEEAGLYFKLPPPVDGVLTIDRRVHVLDPALESGEAECLTADKKNLVVHCFLIWSVSDPEQYYKSVGYLLRAEARLVDILRAQVGSVISTHMFSDLVSAKAEDAGKMSQVTDEITERCAKLAGTLGIEVAAVRIKRINFPSANKSSLFRRMEAERTGVSMKIRSEGQAMAAEIRAKAKREQAELVNDALRQKEEIEGKADAEAYRIYAEAYQTDPEFFELARSLEAYQAVFGEDDFFLIPSDHAFLKVLNNPGEYLNKGDGSSDE